VGNSSSVLVLLAIVGLIFHNDPAGAWNRITQQMSYFLDQSAVHVVQHIAQKASQPGKGLIATVIGVARLRSSEQATCSVSSKMR
jgi:hypothetical protein